MSFTKINTNSTPKCNYPDHRPPTGVLLDEGRYEWTCGKCGNITIINILRPSC